MTKFNIGDVVWIAQTRDIQKQVTCPDCFGKKFLTVILGDDSRVTIDCAGCARGYEPPRGFVIRTDKVIHAQDMIVNAIETRTDKPTEYNHYQEPDVFATEEEAKTRAAELFKEREAEELRRLSFVKENLNRTWVWNVTYHRRGIKEAEKQLAYHTAKLEAAKAHVKLPEAEGRTNG